MNRSGSSPTYDTSISVPSGTSRANQPSFPVTVPSDPSPATRTAAPAKGSPFPSTTRRSASTGKSPAISPVPPSGISRITTGTGDNPDRPLTRTASFPGQESTSHFSSGTP